MNLEKLTYKNVVKEFSSIMKEGLTLLLFVPHQDDKGNCDIYESLTTYIAGPACIPNNMWVL